MLNKLRGLHLFFFMLLFTSCSSINKLVELEPKDCLNYTLENKSDGIITVAEITPVDKTDKNELKSSITVYGPDGQILDTNQNLNHIYEIGSLTKTITAALICKAKNDNLLSLDDTIDKYLELPARFKYPTIKSLLTHTSGYKSFYLEKGMTANHLKKRNDFYGITKEQIINRLSRTKINTTKQHQFLYSNFGYSVLGLVLESVYKKPYTQLANDFVQNELGMTHTYIADGNGDLRNYMAWAPDDAYLCAGAFYSTIEDMIIYAKLQLSEDDVFAECHKLLADINDKATVNRQLGIKMDGIAYAWIFDNDSRFWWHNGGTDNYNCYLGFSIERQKAVIVLSNLPPSYKIPATVIGAKMMK